MTRALAHAGAAVGRKLRLLAALWLYATGAAAQNGAAPPPSSPPPVLLPGRSADSLIVFSANCPDSARRRVRVGRILILGNAKTRPRVLLAELDFAEGDSLDVTELRPRLEANRRRVYNLQLFHAVLWQVSCLSGAGAPNGDLTLTLIVRERWYLFPVPIFSLAERNLRAWAARPDRWQRVDYGLHLVQNNFRGANEQLTLNLQHGFDRKYELFYTIPYFDRRRRLGLSVGASLRQSHSLDYATLADRLQTYRSPTDFPLRRVSLGAGLRWRRTIERLTRLTLNYRTERITDSVLQFNPRYLGRTGATERTFLEVEVYRTINKRNTFGYPLTGSYLEFGGHIRVSPNRSGPLEGQLSLNYTRYFSLPHQFYYAAELQLQGRLTRTVAYPDNRALGYGNTVRGYELYVADGQHAATLRQGLSRRLLSVARLPLPTRVGSRFGDVPLALYLNLFADAGLAIDASAAARQNTLVNRPLGSAGLGLHLVTYYDRVVVLEAALNHRRQPTLVLTANFPI